MSQHNKYYTLVSSDTSAGLFVVRFRQQHPVFAGHFPGQPVVPGACLVQTAEELLATLKGCSVYWTAVRNLKFRQLVTPDMEVCFHLTPREDTCSVLITCTENTYAQFTASYMCSDSDL